jgi:C-terminal processing protease CtpA/Prc
MRLVITNALGALLAALCLAACGGGGGGGGAAAAPGGSGGGSTGLTWTQGVFPPASGLVNACEVVRTGVDQEGRTFPDRQGTRQQELFWLRSWTNETYLWNTEVTDRDPNTFADRLAYFDVLKTTAITASGKPKDQFHFTQPTAEFIAQRNATPTATYGARLRVFSSTPPRDVRVLYTEPGSPASQQTGGVPNLVRGSRILTVDGNDVVNGANTTAINAGLFPATAGETHTFTVQDPGGATRTVTLQSVNLASLAVNRVATIPVAGGSVGYMLINTFNTFASEQQIANAINNFRAANVSDLVIDLRYNGGGLLAVASELGFQVAGPAQTSGRVFERLRFNAAAGSLDPVNGGPNTPTPFYSTARGFSLPSGTPLQSLNLPRVYVLSTSTTCSASEAVVNALRGIGVNVVLIGTTTCGKPFGFFPASNCGVTYFSIQFQGVNDVGFGDYADGFAPANAGAPFSVSVPGCAVADDLTRELGDPQEALLAAALQHRATGACPPPPPVSVEARPQSSANAIRTTDLTPMQQLMETNRDLRLGPDGDMR